MADIKSMWPEDIGKMKKCMFSRASDEYETPPWLFSMLDKMFAFTLDPAASDSSHVCPRYYTAADDGLSRSWEGETWFINPPYSKARLWIKGAAQRFTDKKSRGVVLIPARTETLYWHEHIWPIAHYILFLKGRLKFVNKTLPSYGKGGKPSPAPYPSCVVIYCRPVLWPDALDELSKYGRVLNLWDTPL